MRMRHLGNRRSRCIPCHGVADYTGNSVFHGIHHMFTVEAVIPYTTDKIRKWEVNVLRAIHPVQYLTQAPVIDARVLEPMHCARVCPVWVGCCPGCCSVGSKEAVAESRSLKLIVPRPHISLMNDTAVAFRLEGRLADTVTIRLLRIVREVSSGCINEAMSESVSSSLFLPRSYHDDEDPVFESCLLIDAFEIANAVSMDTRLFRIQYYLAVTVDFDNGCCASLLPDDEVRVPITIYNSVSESSPMPVVVQMGLVIQPPMTDVEPISGRIIHGMGAPDVVEMM